MDFEDHDARPRTAPGSAGEASAPARLRRWTSTELLGRGGEIVIEHAGREYRLRITQNGKLILTA